VANGDLKEPYLLRMTLRYMLKLEELDNECMGLYKHRHLINTAISAQILYN
jgi:hypothetical protein